MFAVPVRFSLGSQCREHALVWASPQGRSLVRATSPRSAACACPPSDASRKAARRNLKRILGQAWALLDALEGGLHQLLPLAAEATPRVEGVAE
eukprot:764745-Prymnesium_polylepis.1